MTDYLQIYNMMEPDRPYTAAQLGIHPSSLTAMVNRGMIERRDTKPRTYLRSAKNELATVLEMLRLHKPARNLFMLYKHGQSLGMMCQLETNRILDCWGEPYDITGVEKLFINGEEYLI